MKFFILDDKKFFIMSNNELMTNVNSNGMGRSVSSARFQIAKVSDDDAQIEASLDKAASIPHSKSMEENKSKEFHFN